jgi:hypothetical protein
VKKKVIEGVSLKFCFEEERKKKKEEEVIGVKLKALLVHTPHYCVKSTDIFQTPP